MRLRNTVIYLIGVPAVGKYTVARELARMTGAKVVDNQLVNTPVYSVVGYDGTDAFPFPPAAAAQVEKIHRARLKDVDLTNISRWLREFEVLKVPHPNALTLDTSRLEPREAARRILEHVTSRGRQQDG